MARPLKIVLLSTTPIETLGSMGSYEQLVIQSLSSVETSLDVQIVRLLPTFPASSTARLRAIIKARWQAAMVKADVIHLLDGSFGYLIGSSMWRRTPQKRTVITVHDLIPALQAKGHFQGVARPSWQAQRLITNSLDVIRTAAGVVSDSEATARDVAHLSGRTVDSVIPLPLRALAEIPSASTWDQRLKHPYILHVGHNGFYKNRTTVIQAFSRLTEHHPQLDLVLAGSPDNAGLQELITSKQLQHRVHWIAEPSDPDLAWLYSHASVLLFPSLYEGFGWPPLEAMHYNCPVVSSTAGSLPEVCGQAALMADPSDVEAIGIATHRLLTEPALRQTMLLRGKANLMRFRSNQLLEGLLGLYQRVAAQ